MNIIICIHITLGYTLIHSIVTHIAIDSVLAECIKIPHKGDDFIALMICYEYYFNFFRILRFILIEKTCLYTNKS